jgi:hypothetical protein
MPVAQAQPYYRSRTRRMRGRVQRVMVPKARRNRDGFLAKPAPGAAVGAGR